jgi:hypothetical protein
MKWFTILVLAASLAVFLLVPDHEHAMIWIGSGYLILSYVLIPRKPQIGWICSFTGNALYLQPVAQLHRLDLMVVPTVFTALSLWNVWNELNKTSKK